MGDSKQVALLTAIICHLRAHLLEVGKVAAGNISHRRRFWIIEHVLQADLAVVAQLVAWPPHFHESKPFLKKPHGFYHGSGLGFLFIHVQGLANQYMQEFFGGLLPNSLKNFQSPRSSVTAHGGHLRGTPVPGSTPANKAFKLSTTLALANCSRSFSPCHELEYVQCK